MEKSREQASLTAASELGFLTSSQLELIREDAKESNLPEMEIAIRKGLLNRRQLEIIQSFREPLNVAPGYRIDGLIGKGGAGVVYMATQLGLDRSVALKTISHSVKKNELAPKRFEREAKIIGQLRHPNIVSAVDFGIHKDQLYLVMEFVDGIDAEKYLGEHRRMPEGHAWNVARQVCHALSYANEMGVIHRDIKPANLILTSPPKGSPYPSKVPFAKIADFGLARFKEPTSENNITIESAVSGTPFYMSPEQISAKPLDHRSDIFSLGATIWHLIVGHPPITGATPADVFSNRLKLKDDWAENSNDKLSRVGSDLLREMCRFNADERIDDYSELDSRIESVLNQLKSTAMSSESISDELDFTSEDFTVRSNITYVGDLESLQPSATLSDIADAQRLGEVEKKQKPPSTAKSSAAHGRYGLGKWLAIAAVLTGLVVASILAWNRFNTPFANAAYFESIKLEKLTGPPIFQFDGLSVDHRQKFTGTWEVGQGAEREPVLSGNGTRDFICVDAEGQDLGLFQFECGFRHHESEKIEFRLLDPTGQMVFRVDVTPTQASLIFDDKEQSSVELEMFKKESFGYHLIHIESQPEHWRITINSDLLGTVAKNNNLSTEPATIQLAVNGTRNGHFEQIRFRRFAAKPIENSPN